MDIVGDLRARTRGEVFAPRDAGYETARAAFNAFSDPTEDEGYGSTRDRPRRALRFGAERAEPDWMERGA